MKSNINVSKILLCAILVFSFIYQTVPAYGVRKASILYYHTDHLGNSSLVTDANGQVKQRFQSYPYGETLLQMANDIIQITNYKFTGQEHDPETGLYYYGARYYDPGLSRFISLDPADEDPNPYAYVLSNPIRFTDPEGEGPDEPPEFDWKGWRIQLDKREGIYRCNEANEILPKPWRKVTEEEIATLPSEELRKYATTARRQAILRYHKYTTDPNFKIAHDEYRDEYYESNPDAKERQRKRNIEYMEKRIEADKKWYGEQNLKSSVRRRERRASDEEYRKEKRRYEREYKKQPEVRAKSREMDRKRYWEKKGYSEPPPKRGYSWKKYGVVSGVIGLRELFGPNGESEAANNYNQ